MSERSEPLRIKRRQNQARPYGQRYACYKPLKEKSNVLADAKLHTSNASSCKHVQTNKHPLSPTSRLNYHDSSKHLLYSKTSFLSASSLTACLCWRNPCGKSAQSSTSAVNGTKLKKYTKNMKIRHNSLTLIMKRKNEIARSSLT